MTEAEFNLWLMDDSASRCVLVEVGVLSGGIETVRYLSDKGYKVSSTFYEPLISGGIEFTETINIDGEFSFSYGDIELDNTDGSLDEWIDDVFENRDVTILIGDMTWDRSDFVTIFSGTIGAIDIRDRSSFNLKLVDKLQRINTTTSEVKLGIGVNADKLIPVCIGEPHNITPLIVDDSVQEYVVNDGEVEQITEVRDNGIPVSFTDVGNGRFRLNQASYGTITASVQGAVETSLGGYISNVPDAIRYVVQHLLPDDKKFTNDEIDVANFDAVASEFPSPVGVYITDKTNALVLCNSLAASINHKLICGRAGELRLVEITPVRSDAGTIVDASDMEEHSIHIDEVLDVKSAVKIGYAKNFTLQQTVAAGVPSPHAELYSQEWLTVTRESSSVVADYKMSTDATMKETLLISEADAITQANKEIAWKSSRRKIIKYVGFANLLTQEIGSTQTIKHSRFGLSSGVAGQIVHLKTNWTNSSVEVGVLI